MANRPFSEHFALLTSPRQLLWGRRGHRRGVAGLQALSCWIRYMAGRAYHWIGAVQTHRVGLVAQNGQLRGVFL